MGTQVHADGGSRRCFARAPAGLRSACRGSCFACKVRARAVTRVAPRRARLRDVNRVNEEWFNDTERVQAKVGLVDTPAAAASASGDKVRERGSSGGVQGESG